MKKKHKYLVYTSAGDNSNLNHWLNGKRDFDLWITYYKDYGQKYKGLADYYNTRPGGKFPNLLYIYQHYQDILSNYDAIMLMDDDIIIDTNAINELFRIREKYDFWILQPAFDPSGKISHPITQVNPDCYLRYTNFVENTCPLFKKSKLDDFMQYYDPILVGWGIDWWYLDILGPDLDKKAAIIDQIPCINPHNHHKKDHRREIDKLMPAEERRNLWLAVKEKYNLTSEDRGFVEYSRIPKKMGTRSNRDPHNDADSNFEKSMSHPLV